MTEPGYYWVKTQYLTRGGEWEPAEFDGSYWYGFGDCNFCNPDDIDQVGPRLEPPKEAGEQIIAAVAAS
jgi:hypothetical protein